MGDGLGEGEGLGDGEGLGEGVGLGNGDGAGPMRVAMKVPRWPSLWTHVPCNVFPLFKIVPVN